eukprot:TRINITY_DN1731_c0_g1_i3.p1 TRINITY_DN1731_c0_g1~~TRINITY_DN1731_c0_g1_i3.p1  ORF type:complete len:2359 (-),score=485.36 TRINITY_DN1731_c0_g1_i3:92-7168(-)
MLAAAATPPRTPAPTPPLEPATVRVVAAPLPDASSHATATKGEEGGCGTRLITDGADPFPTETAFVRLLRSVEGPQPSPEIFHFLFGLLSDPNDNPDKLDFLRIFFDMLMSCDSATQAELLRRLNSAIKVGGLQLEAELSRRHWILRILSMFPPSFTSQEPFDEIIRLLNTLAGFSISVHELKLMLKMMQGTKAEKPSYWHHLLGVMRSVSTYAGPTTYWQFSGRDSGLKLPTFRLPTSDGYTFMMWVRFESLSDSAVYIASFLNGDLNGLELYLQQRFLAVRSTVKKAKCEVQVLRAVALVAKRWYFVALTHMYHLWQKSELSLYLDGAFIEKVPLLYPKADVTSCCLGTNLTPAEANTRQVRAQPFTGQLGQVFLLQGVAEPPDVAAVYHLGPSCMPNRSEIGQIENTFCFSGRRSLKIIFAFHPKASDGYHCYDTSSVNLDRVATHLPGSSLASCLPLHLAFHKAGGARLLLPLISQADLPSAPSPFEVAKAPTVTDDPDSLSPAATLRTSASSPVLSTCTTDCPGAPSALPRVPVKSKSSIFAGASTKEAEATPAQCLCDILNLLNTVIAKYPEDLHTDKKFFQLLSYALSQLSPAVWDQSTINSLEELANTLSRNHEVMLKHFFQNVLLRFDTWVYCPAHVQGQLVALLARHAKQTPQLCREVIGVPRIVEVLRGYYWFKPEEGVSRAVSPFVKDNQGAVTRPSCSDVHQLRLELIKIMSIITRNQLTQDELKSITLYLHSCTDDEQCVDIAQFLLSALADVTSPTWEHAWKRRDSVLRAWSLKLACLTLKARRHAEQQRQRVALARQQKAVQLQQQTVKQTDHKQLEDEGQQINKQDDASDGNDDLTEEEKEPIPGRSLIEWVSALKLALQEHPLTKVGYNVLLELLFDRLDSKLRSSVQLSGALSFAFPEVLSVIFDLVAKSGCRVLQCVMLYEFAMFLTASVSNRATFLSFPYWQTWIFNQLAVKDEGEVQQQQQSSNDLTDLAVQICATLFQHLLSSRNGAATIFDCVSLLFHFGESGGLGGANPARLAAAVDRALLAALTRDTPDFARRLRTEQYLIHNCYCWCALAGTLLFPPQTYAEGQQSPSLSRPPAVPCAPDEFMRRLPRRMDGSWEDFHFAQALLRFLDLLHSVTPPWGPPPPPPTMPASSHGSSLQALPALSSAGTASSRRPRATSGGAGASAAAATAVAAATATAAAAAAAGLQLAPLLDALFLQLTLASLQETANTSWVKNQQEGLLKVSAMFRSFGVPDEMPPTAATSFEWYIKARSKALEDSSAVFESAVHENVNRIHMLLARYTAQEDKQGELMCVLTFLSKASHGCANGRSTQVASLFREVLLQSREALGDAVPSCERDDDLVLLFESHIHSEPLHHLNQLDEAMRSVCGRMELLVFLQHCCLQERKRTLTHALATHVSEEHLTQATMFEEMVTASHATTEEEEARQQFLKMTNARVSATHRRMWHDFMQNLWPKQIDHWSLDPMENNQRMHKRLQPNWRFDPHKDRVPISRDAGDDSAASMSGSVSSEVVASLPAVPTCQDEAEEVPVGATAEQKSEEFSFPELGKGAKCELIEPMRATPGTLEITQKLLRFVASGEGGQVDHVVVNAQLLERSWTPTTLSALYTRRYLLRNSGLELFFHDRTTVFLNFPTIAVRDSVYGRMSRVFLPTTLIGGIASYVSKPPHPKQILQKLDLTNQWINRKISNFDYLMSLNTLAGRTFNDLSQYPVFPWVLADYTASQLDLTKQATFRDLAMPMGALHPERRAEVQQRYEAFNDPEIPKFHYGTHYSTLGAVLHYLIRLEPFTSFFLEFQGGKFDHANRMFLSIKQSWDGAGTDASSVKELIPEFFYLPELLVNSNRFNFGLPVNDPAVPDAAGLVPKTVGDVVLPPWAEGSPEVFIQKHREALESDYVSDHLNEWIDLIFGLKQRGKAAEEALNVFFYLTYEGMVDVEQISDQQQRKSILSQIYNFGQTPTQLFTTPHPKRISSAEILDRSLSRVRISTGSIPYCFAITVPGYSSPLEYILPVSRDRIVTVDKDGTLGISSFSCAADGGAAKGCYPFAFGADKTLASGVRQKSVQTRYAPNIAPRCAIAASHNAKFIVSCGDWDNRFVLHAPKGKGARSVHYGYDVVTCVSVDGCFVVVGSRDSSIACYHVVTNPLKVKAGTKEDPFRSPARVLYGHTGSVQCICVSENYDMVVSASHGTGPQCLIHTLRTGMLVRQIPIALPVESLHITSQGYVVALCSVRHPDNRRCGALFVFNPNASLVAQCAAPDLALVVPSPDGAYLLCASCAAGFAMRHTNTLRVVHQFDTDAAITAVHFVGDNYIMAGLANGTLSFFPFVPALWPRHVSVSPAD